MNTLFIQLTWWEIALLGIYSFYTVIRAFWIFDSGLRQATIGKSRDIKLYHILWSVIDIPAIILGTLFPLFKRLFSITVVHLKH